MKIVTQFDHNYIACTKNRFIFQDIHILFICYSASEVNKYCVCRKLRYRLQSVLIIVFLCFRIFRFDGRVVHVIIVGYIFLTLIRFPFFNKSYLKKIIITENILQTNKIYMHIYM